MNYDEMSVDELLDEMDSEVGDGYPRDIKKVAALRKAVIRETSVGTCYQLDTDISHAVLGNVPEGKYDLIPKETP